MIFTLILFSCLVCFGQKSPLKIDAYPDSTISLSGNLSQGELMEDLSWAWNSSNACFVATQATKFKGNHLLYQTELPGRAELYIRLKPTGGNKKLSLYAYSIGKSSNRIVPNLPSCVSCEASFRSDFGQAQSERVVRLNAINNPYKVIIGVAGEEGITEADYTLELEWKGGKAPNLKQELTVPVFRAFSKENGSIMYTSDLSKGVKVNDLSWAWNSSNACFVETQKHKYTGNHLLFLTELPRRSEMTITITPQDPSKNFSLYAYSTGKNRAKYIPYLPSCVSCEADHKWDYKRAGKTQNHQRSVQLRAINNPYDVVIGVAGAEGETEGAFTLKIELKQ